MESLIHKIKNFFKDDGGMPPYERLAFAQYTRGRLDEEGKEFIKWRYEFYDDIPWTPEQNKIVDDEILLWKHNTPEYKKLMRKHKLEKYYESI